MTPRSTIPPEAAEQALNWLTRLHSGKCSLCDRRAAAQWRQADPSHEAAYQEAQSLWFLASGLSESADGRVRPAAAVPRSQPHHHPRLRRWAAIAAVLVLTVGMLLWQLPHHLADISTGATQQQATLEDGSTLTLDARSAADFHSSALTRDLILRRGTLFAQVAPARLRPFIVHAGPFKVTAMGTAFEVVRSPDGGIRVAVAEHSVAVGGLPGLAILVKEGERVRIGPDGTVTPLPPAPAQAMAAWRWNRLVIEGQTLGEVAATLAAHSHGWIWVTDDELAATRINAVLDLDDPQGSLAALQGALALDIRGIGGIVTVLSPRK